MFPPKLPGTKSCFAVKRTSEVRPWMISAIKQAGSCTPALCYRTELSDAGRLSINVNVASKKPPTINFDHVDRMATW